MTIENKKTNSHEPHVYPYNDDAFLKPKRKKEELPKRLYTKEDMIHAISLARCGRIKQAWDYYVDYTFTKEEILKRIDSAS
jgi:hypothetical protein